MPDQQAVIVPMNDNFLGLSPRWVFYSVAVIALAGFIAAVSGQCNVLIQPAQGLSGFHLSCSPRGTPSTEEAKLLAEIQKLNATLSSYATLKADVLRALNLVRPWTKVGYLSDFDSLAEKYPFHEFEWGVLYNALDGVGTIQPVIITHWNIGLRVSVQNPFPMGDDAKKFDYGVTIWTRGVDGESQCGERQFAHGYYKIVNGAYERTWTNKCADPAVYVRPQ